MRLKLEDGAVIENPDRERLENALRNLRVPECTFAILERTSSVYMQTAKNQDGSFILEYQNGSLADHYDLPIFLQTEDMVDAFVSYLLETEYWQTGLPWKKARLR